MGLAHQKLLPVGARVKALKRTSSLNDGEQDFDKKTSRYKTWFNQTFNEKLTSNTPSRLKPLADSNDCGQTYSHSPIQNSKSIASSVLGSMASAEHEHQWLGTKRFQ
jgi:hypothetical protein